MQDAPIIALKMLVGNQPTHLNALQMWLSPYADEISILWHTIWILTALVLLARVVREYQRHRARHERE